jgi:hypothetical protein
MIAAYDGVIRKEIMNPGGGSSSSAAATNRKSSYSCVLVSKRGPVTEVERDKALNAATEFADNCKNPYYLVVLKASQAYKSFELVRDSSAPIISRSEFIYRSALQIISVTVNSSTQPYTLNPPTLGSKIWTKNSGSGSCS